MHAPEAEYTGKRVKTWIKRYFKFESSKFCEPCARETNIKHPGIFKELPKLASKKGKQKVEAVATKTSDTKDGKEKEADEEYE